MDNDGYIDYLDRGIDSFLDLAPSALDRPVPFCPGWKGVDLIGHMGAVWRRAGQALEIGEIRDRSDAPELSGTAMIEWATTQGEHLRAMARDCDPAAPCRAFGKTVTKAFWLRRQALEVVVHLADLELALGAPVSLDDAIGVEGIAEFADFVIPRVFSHSPGSWSGEVVSLRPDGARAFTLQLGPEGALEENATDPADLTISGAGAAIYLWCAGRGSLDALMLSGDHSLATRWREELRF